MVIPQIQLFSATMRAYTGAWKYTERAGHLNFLGAVFKACARIVDPTATALGTVAVSDPCPV